MKTDRPIKGTQYRNRRAVVAYLAPENLEILHLLQEQLRGVSASEVLTMGLRSLQGRIGIPLGD